MTCYDMDDETMCVDMYGRPGVSWESYRAPLSDLVLSYFAWPWAGIGI